MSDWRRVVLVSPNWLGDAVMALPAMQDVRRRFPSAHVTVAARPSVAPLFPLVPVVDEVLPLEWRGRMLETRAMRRDVERLRRGSFDTAVLFTNSFATAWLVKQAGIAERAGYRRDLRAALLTKPVQRPKKSVHQGAYYQHLISALGLPAGPLEPVVTVQADVLQRARDLITSGGWDGVRPLIALAPGAAYGKAKQWPPSHFARLISMSAIECGAWCVLVGSQADMSTTAALAQAVDPSARSRVIDLAGRTSLEMLAAVLTLASVCVSNDSGAMHLAAAAGARVAALFGPTRDQETAPLTRGDREAAVLINPVWCRPCMLRECPLDHRCMRGLEPRHVLDAITAMLDTNP